MTMPMFPGFVTNQPLSGSQVGQAIVNFLPCLPGEGPPLMPRVLARAFYPRGFNPFQPFPVAAAPAPPVTLIPPEPAPAPAPAPPAVDTRGNAIARRQLLPVPGEPAQPAPYRPHAVSQRVQIRESAGM